MVLFAAGCATPQAKYGKREVNIAAGLIKAEPGSYGRAGPLTIPLKSSELGPNSNYSGNKVSFLWGLFTYVDE